MRKPTLLLVGLLSCAWATSASAQATQTQLVGTQDIPFDRPESWAMKYFTSVAVLSGLGVPRPIHPGALRLALEGGWVPYLSAQERMIGFDGTKMEDTNHVPVYGRLRLTVGLPLDFALTVGYVPPIEISEVRAHLFAAALERPLLVQGGFVLGARIYGGVGSIDGPFTCSAAEVAAGADLTLNPYDCQAPSNDTLSHGYGGIELGAAYRIDRLHGLEPYFTVAGNYMTLDSQVRASYSNVVDRTRLHTNGSTASVAGGLVFPVVSWLVLAGEAYYAPLAIQRSASDVQTDGLFNVRGMLQFRLH